METKQQRILTALAVAALILTGTLVLGAQSAPVLDQGYAGAVTVSGRVAPGNGSVSIYDVSDTPRIELGVSESVDKDGNFAATVNPALVAGHRIVVVDAQGATSEAMVVLPRPIGPAGPR